MNIGFVGHMLGRATVDAAAPSFNFNFFAQLLGKGPVNGFFVGLSLVLMVIAIGIWVMEFSGHTISRHGIVRNNLKWNAKTIAIIAVSAAIYIAGRPLQLQFVPGIGGFNPSFGLGPVLAILFGLPGVIGASFSMPIGDAISGALTIGSAAGLLGQSFYMYVPYKIVTNASLTKWQRWVRLYAALILGWLLIWITISGWLDFTKLVPPAVAWGAVGLSITINQFFIPIVLVPILLIALLPLVRQWGLYRGDLEGTATEDSRGRGSMRDTAPAGLVGSETAVPPGTQPPA